MDGIVDAAWVIGLFLSIIRVGAFVASSPIFSRAFPPIGRLVLSVAVGLALAGRVPGALDPAGLIGMALVNTVIGLLLGFLTGLIFYLFEIAGSTIDFTSSLSVATVFDPVAGRRFSLFARGFSFGALAIFLVIGGDRLMVRGIATSVAAIPFDGQIQLASGIADVTLDLISKIMVAAIELAMPAIAALFLAELVLGIAARFAPQANVFILGFPVKILAALATVSFVVLAFPAATSGTMEVAERTFREVLSMVIAR